MKKKIILSFFILIILAAIGTNIYIRLYPQTIEQMFEYSPEFVGKVMKVDDNVVLFEVIQWRKGKYDYKYMRVDVSEHYFRDLASPIDAFEEGAYFYIRYNRFDLTQYSEDTGYIPIPYGSFKISQEDAERRFG